MKKFISVILVLVSFAAAFAKEISVKVTPGEHWKEKREPQALCYRARQSQKLDFWS